MKFDRLRPYQMEDAQFLIRYPAMGCFNEQRTGKTPTSLAACALKNCKKILIVCPASAVLPWRDAFEYWYEQPCVVLAGTPKQRQFALANWTDGLVISYDLLKHTARTGGYIDILLKQKPDAVIIDEAHRLQDRKSAQTKAVFRLSKIPYRLALTGTPSPNKSYTVWSILHFLYPKTFSSFWRFIQEHYITKEQYNAQGDQYLNIIKIKPQSEKWLQRILDMCSTSRKRKDVMQWLPEREPAIQVRLTLTPMQQKYLDELEKYYETEHVITVATLDRLMRMRQVCIAPELLGLRGESPKTNWIRQYLRDYPDRPTLIVSKFTSYLQLLHKELHDIPMIVGETPITRRNEIVTSFQKGEYSQIMMNIDTCKEALTLDRAEAMIFIDKYPPVGSVQQMEDRFVATTEERADKANIIYELVMADSYEETIYAMLKQRKKESDIVNNYKEYLERRK